MNCEGCLNKDEYENCGKKMLQMAKNNKHSERVCIMNSVILVRFCPKCKKQAAEYIYNAVGNLVFSRCIACGYSAKEYAQDLEGGNSK